MPNDEKRLTGLLRALQALQAHDDTMPIGMALTFLLVALNEGLSMREYTEQAGVPQQTMSRRLLDLGDRARGQGPGTGLGLIERRQNPMNLRTNEYTLSAKGRGLLRQMLTPLNQ